MELELPLTAEQVRELNVGDEIYLNGTIITARDAAHQKLLNCGGEVPTELKQIISGGAVYHCGPLLDKQRQDWRVLAAGPTTSMRLEGFASDFISSYSPRVLVGKGGMGEKTAGALNKHGSVYVQFTGGAAVVAATAIQHVIDVYWLDELGMAEAVWVLAVENFGPLIVTMDTKQKKMSNK